ncbi:MAG: ABC transporter permease [Dermatophilaceae bacterium]
MRVADYLSFAWRGIVRQRVRTVLTVLALAIAATIVISLVSITVGAQRTITTERGLTEGLETMVVTPNAVVSTGLLGGSVQVANDKAEKITDATVQQLRGLAGVKDAVPLAGVYELRRFTIDGSPTSFVANALAPGEGTSYEIPLLVGRAPAPGTKGHAEVVIDSSYVDALGLSQDPTKVLGRAMTITTVNGYRGVGAEVPGPGSTPKQVTDFAQRATTLTARIVGVSSDPRFTSRILTSMPWAHAIRSPQVLQGGTMVQGESRITTGGYSSVIVDAASTDAVAGVAAQIERFGYGVTSAQEQLDRINRYVLIMWLVLGSIALVSILAAGLSTGNTMLMTITEERYVINVWRVCGARRGLVRRLYLLQAFLLSLAGGVLGMASGYWLTWLLSRQIRAVLAGRGMETISVAEATPQILLAGLAITLIIGVLAAVHPAARASRDDPGAFLTAQ